VTTDSDTKVTKTTKSDVDALKKGQTITVIGEADGEDTVKATTISEGAGLRGGFGARPGAAGGVSGAAVATTRARADADGERWTLARSACSSRLRRHAFAARLTG